MNKINRQYKSIIQIDLVEANQLIESAMEESNQLGLNIAVAIVDTGGHLIAFNRSENAGFLTVDAAINKAWTASSFGHPTHTWNELFNDSKLAPLSNIPRMLAVGGGYPIIHDEKIIGAIGISGGSYTEDQHIAEYALKNLNNNIKDI
ncbi:hypothetical protein P256_02354 [Acinetobacter nectaris CIP 110549]|uniref:Heme-binding protein n=1 Tax=Acinetobacter nectaris CIP 110549 TaxID=1392540 RepID=V2UPP2_9GAMM|nr:heme-binding protein [Acinetobacter nectaris]ESK37299.1 hypothetical protein P256_02354 [Acinetobacter nectaris CIP 110549]